MVKKTVSYGMFGLSLILLSVGCVFLTRGVYGDTLPYDERTYYLVLSAIGIGCGFVILNYPRNSRK